MQKCLQKSGLWRSLRLAILLSILPSLVCAAETVDIVPPLVEGRAIFAGSEYMPEGTRVIIADKVCEALGYSGMRADETKFAVVTAPQEFAFVGKTPDDKLMFYFFRVGRADKPETVGYLSQLTCFK